MNNQIKNERKRATSARPCSASAHKSRPQSGTYLRKQLIQNTYTQSPTQTLHVRASSAKSLSIKQASTLYDSGKLKRAEPKIVKEKEVLAEQIVSLKLKINGLVQQLGHQRGKTEEIRKKHNRFARVLNVEFQNERLWNAGIINTHKVEGMRNMYDKLKQEHELLKQEYFRLQKTIKVTKELEYIKYIEILEQEIKSFHKRFDRIGQYSLELLNHEGQHQKEANMHMIGQFQHQQEQMTQRYHKLKSKYQMTSQNLKDRNKKISFLEKYNRDLENKISSLDRQVTIKDKQIKKIQFQHEKLKQQHILFKQSSQNQIAILKLELEENKQNFLVDKNKIITDKDQQIANLAKQNHYYQDMIKELRKTNNQINKECQNLKKKQVSDSITKKFSELAFSFPPEEQRQTPKASKQNKSPQKQQKSNEASTFLLGKRVRQTADRRFNQTSLKKRRVQQDQISQIAQVLRLKFVGNSVPIQEIIPLFSYKSDPTLPQSQNKWRQQHIKMKQIYDIFREQPFELPEQKAEILSRYIIEDVQQQFVYVDEHNQNYRNIVKSILKNLFGQYIIIKGNQKINAEIKLFFQRYSANLNSVLTSIEPSGKIAKKRFTDTLNSLGTQYSQDLLEAFLGTMAIQAQNLSSLNYVTLYERFGEKQNNSS